jgi:hypothetical protein
MEDLPMSCEYGDATLDSYFDHELSAVEQAALLAHCRHCAVCRAAVDQHTQYLIRLKQFKVAAPTPVLTKPSGAIGKGFAFAGERRYRAPAAARWLFAAAVATCAIGLVWYSGERAETFVPTSGDIWSKVNIVIQVPTNLDGATLTVSLPQGVYVQGQEGLRTLVWNTDFAQGTNALELPIFVDGLTFDRSMPQYLDATLEYQGASKTFEFLVGVDGAGVTL